MNKTIIAFATAGSLAISLSAFANKGAEYKGQYYEANDWSKHWYIGGGINGNSVNTNTHEFDGDEFEFNETDVGFDLFVGRQMNRRWAAEMGFTQLGDTTFDFLDDSDTESQFEVKQWNIHLVGLYKLNVGEHFDLFGKFGGAYLSSTQNFEVADDGVLYDVSESNLGTFGLTWGFGAEVAWDRWGIRGEYNVIRPANDTRDAFYIADIISLNGFYRFSY